MANVLIIDDDDIFCRLFSGVLKRDGYEISYTHSLADGLQLVAGGTFDVVYLDVRLPDGNGLDKLSEIRAAASSPEVIIITGGGTADSAELAIQSGAWDYIQKPSAISVIKLPLIRALQYREEKLKKKPVKAFKVSGITGKSPKMKACCDFVSEAATSDASVFITGETGTEKELFARAIHENSRRAGNRFVSVDCTSLMPNLMDSALFGREKGYSGFGDQRSEGFIKQADGGTLFLNEIGELPLDLQNSLLSVIKEHRFRPLNITKDRGSDFRLIAATNQNLEQLVESGQFRDDLLAFIGSMTLVVPPLREHPDDLAEMAAYFTARTCHRIGIEPVKLSPDFTLALRAYHWPGNARELESAMERSIVAALSGQTLFRNHLPGEIRGEPAERDTGEYLQDENHKNTVTGVSLPCLKDMRMSAYARVEKEYLQKLMILTNQNIAKACRIAGLSRKRFHDLLRKHDLS